MRSILKMRNLMFLITGVMLFFVDQTNACESNQFQCEDGTCITDTLRCDSAFDCPDKSDEVNCPNSECNEGQTICPNGVCSSSCEVTQEITSTVAQEITSAIAIGDSGGEDGGSRVGMHVGSIVMIVAAAVFSFVAKQVL